jgi:hypothetical protein
MNLFEMTVEAERLSRLIDAGIEVLAKSSKESAEAEHALRKATAVAWLEAPKGTVPQREAWVEAETADLKRDLDLAEGTRYTALEAVRSRRAQLSALQSLLAAHRAEAEMA